MKMVHWRLLGGLLHMVQQGGAWVWLPIKGLMYCVVLVKLHALHEIFSQVVAGISNLSVIKCISSYTCCVGTVCASCEGKITSFT